MIRALVLVLLALAGSVAQAGALYRGFCHPTTVDAGWAWCAEAALGSGVGAITSYGAQVSTTQGNQVLVRHSGIARWLCRSVGALGQLADVSADMIINGSTISASATAGTGVTYPAPSTLTLSNANVIGISIPLTFPSCEPGTSLTVGDSIELGWLVGGAILAMAGVLFLARAKG